MITKRRSKETNTSVDQRHQGQCVCSCPPRLKKNWFKRRKNRQILAYGKHGVEFLNGSLRQNNFYLFKKKIPLSCFCKSNVLSPCFIAVAPACDGSSILSYKPSFSLHVSSAHGRATLFMLNP